MTHCGDLLKSSTVVPKCSPLRYLLGGHWLTVNTINQDGNQRPMRLDFDEKSKTLKLRSDAVLTDAGIIALRQRMIEAIDAKELEFAKEIAKLRNLCDLLQKV